MWAECYGFIGNEHIKLWKIDSIINDQYCGTLFLLSSVVSYHRYLPLLLEAKTLLVSMHPSQPITQSWKPALMSPAVRNLKPLASFIVCILFRNSFLISASWALVTLFDVLMVTLTVRQTATITQTYSREISDLELRKSGPQHTQGVTKLSLVKCNSEDNWLKFVDKKHCIVPTDSLFKEYLVSLAFCVHMFVNFVHHPSGDPT